MDFLGIIPSATDKKRLVKNATGQNDLKYRTKEEDYQKRPPVSRERSKQQIEAICPVAGIRKRLKR